MTIIDDLRAHMPELFKLGGTNSLYGIGKWSMETGYVVNMVDVPGATYVRTNENIYDPVGDLGAYAPLPVGMPDGVWQSNQDNIDNPMWANAAGTRPLPWHGHMTPEHHAAGYTFNVRTNKVGTLGAASGELSPGVGDVSLIDFEWSGILEQFYAVIHYPGTYAEKIANVRTLETMGSESSLLGGTRTTSWHVLQPADGAQKMTFINRYGEELVIKFPVGATMGSYWGLKRFYIPAATSNDPGPVIVLDPNDAIINDAATIGFIPAVAADANAAVVSITDSNIATAGPKVTVAISKFTDSSDYASLSATTFTPALKRKTLKNLMRQVVANLTNPLTYVGGKAELMKFAQALDNSKISDDILIVKAGETISQDVAAMSIYSPFEDGESVTINDSSNSDLLIIMGQEGDNYTLKIGNVLAPTVNAESIDMGQLNQAGNVYTHTIGSDVVVGLEREYTFIWGSGAIGGGSSGGASGDPYITTIGGTTYKMDDFTGTARMLQGQLGGKLFTLNAQTNLLTPGEITELINWRKDNLGSRQFKKHSEFAEFPAYFSKLSVTWGDDSFVIDINTLEIESATYDVVVSRGYSLVREYQWSDKKSAAETATISIGKTKLVVYSYENKDVRNGFTLNNASGVGNRSGALEHAIYTEDMKLSGLMSTKAITQLSTRESGKRTTSEQFLEGGVEQKTVEFNVY